MLAFQAPRQVLVAWRPDQVRGVIAAAEAAARQGQWALGLVAYEAAPAFDPALTVRPALADFPLAWFALFDAPQAGPSPVPADFACTPWRAEIDAARFEADIAAIHEDIRCGRLYQSNHTTRWRAQGQGAPEALFAALRRAQPGGYGLYLDGGDWQVLSVSPELFFDWDGAGRLATRPMKGTAPRHADPTQDAAAASALAASAKERAENLMIVDLLRNDLSRVAVTGSVAVPRLFTVEPLPSVWQMTSSVECRTRPDIGLVDLFAALFPCGSVTGAPKVTAMQSIAERETSPRGPYCGALGVIRPGGHATFSVGIRTVLWRGEAVECGIGSGITLDATAAGEGAEWQAKGRFLWRASAGFRLLETLRLESGCYPLLHRHLARMAASAAHFGFAWSEPALRDALADLAAAHAQGTWRVRLLLDRDGAITGEAYALEPTPDHYAVAWAAAPVDGGDLFLRHKTTHRPMYERHAPPPDSGCFDTLLYNERGEVTEFTKGNLVAEVDGQRLTPALSCGLLPGTLRAELLARGEVREAVLHRADVERASALWFVNGLRGMVPVRLR
ncbi:aminodeoxychorismate synthase component I [Denitratisoma sp. agr-D3]